MRILFVTAAVIALSACNSQQPAKPAPSAAPTPTADATPTLPPPDQAAFTAAYAEACPTAKKVSTALCESEGFGKEGFSCHFGLGDDPYRRYTISLKPGDGKWVIADPATACDAANTPAAEDSGSAQ